MIKTESVSFGFESRKLMKFPDLDLKSGEDLLVIGESGVGKTTFMHLLAGLRTPATGKIRIADMEIQSLHQIDRDRFRGSRIGIIYQKPYSIRSITVLENLLLIQHLGTGKGNRLMANQILENLGLQDHLNRKPWKLSQGQQQRLSIAMAVINDPEIILADEPTSSLDDKNCESVIELLRKVTGDSRRNLVVITHDQRLHKYFSNKLVL